MQDGDVLEIYVIYERPTDYPAGFLARKWLVDGSPEPRPTPYIATGQTLEEVRACIPRHCVKIERSSGDHRHIVEVWL
jgi:hypothetical protein